MSANVFPTPPLPFTRLATISTSTTWDHPDGYSQPRPIRVLCVGGGGGGASGAVSNQTTGTARVGGGGGGSSLVLFADLFISSQATITIGAGGTGGALATITGTGNTNGNAGGNPGDTTFSTSTNYLKSMNAEIINALGNLGAGTNGAGGSGGSAGGTSPSGSTPAANYPGASFGYSYSISSLPYSLFNNSAPLQFYGTGNIAP